jgi:D-tyrosyl-tRNA(Tyr) deacylase
VRLVVQRVIRARVLVDGRVVGEIGGGLVVLVGVSHNDTVQDAAYLAEKTANLRIFEDSNGKMNLSLLDLILAGADARRSDVRLSDALPGALVVSQFTLYGDARKGRRPAFDQAARPEAAHEIYNEYVSALRLLGVYVQTGVFQAHMAVELSNDGPVTLLLDSTKLF